MLDSREVEQYNYPRQDTLIYSQTNLIEILASRCSSVVEQRFCKPLVVGSSPTIGSHKKSP
jgi:hypothetical protein